jgi:hypothetical protein
LLIVPRGRCVTLRLGMLREGGEGYFSLAIEWRFWRRLRSLPSDCCRATFRPTPTFTTAKAVSG